MLMIRNEIIGAIRKVVRRDIHLEFPENFQHGDYSTNAAMQFGLDAKKIVLKLSKDKKLSKIVSKIEIAGPGFINFFLSKKTLYDNLNMINLEKLKYGKSGIGKDKTVVVEYSSPNIAKRFSIGHLRSTIVGQALYNFYKVIGYKVIGDNHLGDWGTQFGVLLRQFTIYNLQFTDLTIDKLEDLYVRFNKSAKENPKLWEEARAWFAKLEKGDPEARKIWTEIRKLSLEEFDEIYSKLGVKIDHEHGESFYEDKIDSIVKELRNKGISIKSQGAEIIEFSDHPPAMIIKSDGTSTYFTRDLAQVKFRLDEYRPSKIIYEVGADQTLHFRQLFSAVGKLGWGKDVEFVHIPHGLIQLESGKMSTRAGKTIKLSEVLDKAIKKASELGAKTGPLAEKVGIGAIKWNDLKREPKTGFTFNWDEILNMQGNSGPYMQYTYARAKSVLRKTKIALKTVPYSISLTTEEEVILRYLSRFPEILVNAADNYSPNLLCEYLFALAGAYNAFYNKHKIIGDPNEAGRIALTKATVQVIKNGLLILGINVPERM
ncbi:MAG: Arginine-tRNA ligase [Candidatus Woesebacteria bacterium GW2011_GWB1_43_14]|uniref:Arginine--tRNA ligase n=1 Tax=Candidatus Woesebacteria bacterium GW2011_GWB1_43_14 TaxID=1618578 RepID=A0A0G1DH27_9BACT|nr:MAG: Arginine-tRNA ligase [Candidatus Woesebacteria bacterium GW2011_GWC1_42_9]KKS96887.1 MAG: Arginine-tRNA ligase [Candidatus Woesebacteria bacterium GW2011_GWB1_43_14]